MTKNDGVLQSGPPPREVGSLRLRGGVVALCEVPGPVRASPPGPPGGSGPHETRYHQLAFSFMEPAPAAEADKWLER